MNKLILLILLFPALVAAGSETVAEKATPQEVHEKVAAAVQFLSASGEKGLREFENPNGKFVWKDTYVWVTQCEKQYCLPSPVSHKIGLMSKVRCLKTGKFYILDLCGEVAENDSGAWVEYWWSKPGTDELRRKVSFMMQVPGTPYQVVSGIYDKSTTLEDLYKITNRK